MEMFAFDEIVLEQKTIDDIEKYRSSNLEWANQQLRRAKAEIWIEKNLEKIMEECTYKKLGRCWERGENVYRRKDGTGLTVDDIAAVNQLYQGQYNDVKGNVGDMKVAHVWECDSSD